VAVRGGHVPPSVPDLLRISWAFAIASILSTGPSGDGRIRPADTTVGWPDQAVSIRTVAALHALSSEEARQKRPAYLTGVVTFSADSLLMLFVQDETGGAFIARYGLKRTLVFMALCMNIPHLCYVILSQLQSPDAHMSFYTIGALVTVEKFGYSFGFVANMLYMMQQISPGKYHMTHYAFCTALMNLVLIPTQASSGWIADEIGYKNFFLFVMVASIPSVIAAWFAPFPNTPSASSESSAREGRQEPAEAV